MIKKSVLIVDDSSTIRMYHRQILEEAGFAVEEAVNGYEGLEKAMAKEFALFMVDINMPIMDGYTFLRKLRAVSAAPAIMISNEADERDAQCAYEAGASFYIVKPVERGALLLNINLLTGGAD